MGAKPTVQLAPFIITRRVRNDSNWSKGPIWIHIHSHLKQWGKLGTHFDLPIITQESLHPSDFQGMIIDTPKYKARVTNVIHMDNNTVVLHVSLKRRLMEKKLDYRYGGAINYLDSHGNL